MHISKHILLSQRGVQSAAIWRDYISLTKPRVISLLLLTTLCAMIASGQPLRLATVVLTLVGGYLAAGGAGALNCYLDRDIDNEMARTRLRPLPAGRLAPRRALLFGLGLSLLAVVVLWLGVNPLTALLALAGNLFYVLVYTGLLKRRTTQNIVIGGAAGAFPPLVGWAAASGALAPLAWWLFVVICLWTPPHFWALALVRRREYARAGVPMLPVVVGEQRTRNQIFTYTVILVAVTLLPVAFGSLGLFYGLAAAGLGGRFLYAAWQLRQHPSTPATWRLYKYSLLYLALLFLAVAFEQLLMR